MVRTGSHGLEDENGILTGGPRRGTAARKASEREFNIADSFMEATSMGVPS